jgi:hypothetical protein
MRSPSYLVFSQHGMVDTYHAMEALAKRNSGTDDRIIAPDLGYLNTLFSIEPLIEKVETIAAREIRNDPDVPIRIIGCSLGGVIWTEILTRHPEWWSRVESWVLLGSPIGGAHLAKIADPLNWMSFAIAQDLGVDRRPLAEAIASVIPTLIVAGDSDQGGDGTVLVQTTQFQHARFTCIPGVDHPGLRFSEAVDESIKSFWDEQPKNIVLSEKRSVTETISQLRSVPGMTDAHPKNFGRSQPIGTLKEGIVLRVWNNPMGVKYVFLENDRGECEFGGYVGWVHREGLDRAIQSVLRS